jgi:hypothetical protein
MNEKIKNLFNICGMPNEDIMELFEDKNKTFYMEKFAKLIIQECINEVSQYHSTTIYDGFIPENPTREHYEEWAYIKGSNTGYNDAVSQITDGLKEHFGVE